MNIFSKFALMAFAFTLVSQTAYAHPHRIVTPGIAYEDGRLIGGGKNHPKFQGSLSCESFGVAGGGGVIGKSWYGIETAHHGPDSGDPGKGDDCYAIDGLIPGQDVNNPVIR